MDVERHSVAVDGREVNMPLKEFELLELLLRNAGRVLTRGQLIDRVWGSDYFGDTKTLDVHIKRIRSKIEESPSEPTRARDGARPRATASRPSAYGVGVGRRRRRRLSVGVGCRGRRRRRQERRCTARARRRAPAPAAACPARRRTGSRSASSPPGCVSMSARNSCPPSPKPNCAGASPASTSTSRVTFSPSDSYCTASSTSSSPVLSAGNDEVAAHAVLAEDEGVAARRRRRPWR